MSTTAAIMAQISGAAQLQTSAPRVEISTLIEMPYAGSVVSKNHMYRGGRRESGLHKEAQQWKDTLSDWLMALGYFHFLHYIAHPVHIEVGARFKDGRTRCDMHNLVELIADAVQDGIGVDDKHFTISTHPPTFGHTEPVILVTVRLVIEA